MPYDICREEKIWEIRFIKLYFTLKTLESSEWPENKASALRGGMGEMLLRMHCIKDRQCEHCRFESECLVRRMMYSKMKIQPPFMSRGDSVGYILECMDFREHISADNELRFTLLLFGENIAYIGLYLQAFQYLGMAGVGKAQSRFRIQQVLDQDHNEILEDGSVCVAHTNVKTLQDYINEMGTSHNSRVHMTLQTPLAIKYQGELLQKLDMAAIMQAIVRRVFILDCFEGIETQMLHAPDSVPRIVSQNVFPQKVKRYSSTHQDKISLNGIRGTAELDGIDERSWKLLQIGSLIHIGKNTSFGFGKYTVMTTEEQYR